MPCFATRMFAGFRSRCVKPADQLHHKVVRTDIVDLTDIGVVERRDGPRLLFESRGEGSLGNLERDVAAELCIGRLPHLPHPAFADRRNELVSAELIASFQFHVAAGA